MAEKEFKRVDINSASIQEIADNCVMLGKEKAEAIVRHREMHGPFKSLEELRKIPGFSWKLSEGLEDYFVLGEEAQAMPPAELRETSPANNRR